MGKREECPVFRQLRLGGYRSEHRRPQRSGPPVAAFSSRRRRLRSPRTARRLVIAPLTTRYVRMCLTDNETPVGGRVPAQRDVVWMCPGPNSGKAPPCPPRQRSGRFRSRVWGDGQDVPDDALEVVCTERPVTWLKCSCERYRSAAARSWLLKTYSLNRPTSALFSSVDGSGMTRTVARRCWTSGGSERYHRGPTTKS